MSRFIQERAELDAIEAEEASAYDNYRQSVNRNAANGSMQRRWQLWERIADRARADYYGAP